MNRKIIYKHFLKSVLHIISAICLLYGNSFAQDQTMNEKMETSMQLSLLKKANLTKSVLVSVKAKCQNNKFLPANNVKINLYLQDITKHIFVTSSYTDHNGKAIIALPDKLPLDADRFFTITAKIENEKMYEDAQEQLHYREANLIIKLIPSDTSRQVSALLTESVKDGKDIPVKDAEVKFYVQRLFGIMPAAEENTATTDENGIAEFYLPKDVKGDTIGNINIIARIEDNSSFGNIESEVIVPWGVPLTVDKNPFPRALWEPYAPLPLILTISILFGGVWFTYCFILYQLRKIKSESHYKT